MRIDIEKSEMSKWAKMVKRLDGFFLFLALICSSLFFILIFGLFLDVAKEASEASSASYDFAGIIMVITYFYWLCRALWYMVKSTGRQQ